MSVRVELQWSEGEPSMSVSDGPDGLIARIDPRLSESQVRAACAELDGSGDAVYDRWQQTVGLSAEGGLAR